MTSLHPAHRLCCSLLVGVSLQCVSGAGLLLAIALLPVLGRASLVRWLRLLRRARWLLLTLLIVLAWGIAGEPLWEEAGRISPTYEGLTEAATQLGRLVLVLAAVASLLETTPIERLMAGTHILLRPLAGLGLDVNRAVVRLSLALHYAEQMPSRDWRNILSPIECAGPQTVCLVSPPAQLKDWLVLAVTAILAAGVCLT
jgi:energy-coupling factor transporter transmembrane protein EcfT